MDANKSSAVDCVRRAEDLISRGQKEDAIVMLKKSLKLFPTAEAEKLLDSLKVGGARKRSPSSPRPYSDEDVRAVVRIQQCSSFYEMMELDDAATEADVKRAYRRLALTVHPDKNKAPGAVEAFKAISKAFAVLSDAHKRADYDRIGASGRFTTDATGERKAAQTTNGSPTSTAHWYDNYEDNVEFSAEDIFNIFFADAFIGGGGVGSSLFRPRRRRTSKRICQQRGGFFLEQFFREPNLLGDNPKLRGNAPPGALITY